MTTDLLDDWLLTEVRGQVRIAHRSGGSPGEGYTAPQIGALHLRDSYLRLNYGPGAGWGTSVILLPIYWSGGCCHHGARVRATWRAAGGDQELVLDLTGRIGDLEVALSVSLPPPEPGLVRARVAGRARGSVRLDRRPGEAFKPVMLSSMRVAPDAWDASWALAGDHLHAIPGAGWIAPPPAPVCRNLGLLGGTSRWKRNATTIRIALDEPIEVAGWVTPSCDPNDDNVGLWAASDRPLREWSYTILASDPEDDPPAPGGAPGAP